VEEDAATMHLGEDFDHARPMWNAEVTFILRNHLDQLSREQSSLLSGQSSPSSSQATQIIQDTLAYTSSLNTYPSPDAVNTAHDLHQHYPALSEWELALINNCRIDEVDECLSLIPSLREKVERGVIDTQQIEQLLNALKQFQIQ